MGQSVTSFECANCDTEENSYDEIILSFPDRTCLAAASGLISMLRAPPISSHSVIPPSSPSRADVSEGCDGNSICLSLTPSPAKACGGATLLPISISLALAGTARY